MRWCCSGRVSRFTVNQMAQYRSMSTGIGTSIIEAGDGTRSARKESRKSQFYSGSEIWHSRYANRSGDKVLKKYHRVLYSLEVLRKNREVLKSVGTGGLAAWGVLAEKLRQRSKVDLECSIQSATTALTCQELGLLANRLEQIYLHDKGLFREIWREMADLPLVAELVPRMIHDLARSKLTKDAERLMDFCGSESVLSKLSNKQKEVYQEGLINALNGLVYALEKDADERGVSKKYRELYNCIEKFSNGSNRLVLVPPVLNELHRRVPRESYLELFKLLAARGLNFKNWAVKSFLRATFDSSDIAKKLLTNIDSRLVAADPKRDRLFIRDFYKYMLERLSRENNNTPANPAAWLLENIWLKGDHEPDWGMLLYRATEVDGLTTAAQIYKHMIENGITLTTREFLSLLRGFRRNTLEGKCYEVVRLMLSNGHQIDELIATELLTLIAERYDPVVVVKYFALFFPSQVPYLDVLGIRGLLSARNIDLSIVDVPDLPEIQPSQVAQTRQGFEGGLNVIYKSVLNSVDNPDAIKFLFERYKQFAQSHKLNGKAGHSVIILDHFVRNLCQRFASQGPSSLNAAYDIFVGGISSVPYHPTRLQSSRSLQTLIRMFCIAVANRQPNIDRALSLLTLLESTNFLAVREVYYTPVIGYYVSHSMRNEAHSIVQRAQNAGAIISNDVMNSIDK
ncbi:hypothetical protein TRVA0_026S00606 [Trichomonascus vanleenenianus]|uniref:uncharacterized protein n=1 Tax=Trichomonascus vanleenenianus TaxID=2268995 RepID=UPI003ECB73D8